MPIKRLLNGLIYAVALAFVVWPWEGASDDQRPIFFWSVWLMSLGYLLWLSLRLNKRLQN